MANDRYIGYGTFKGLLGKSTENFGEENSYTVIKDEFGNSYESKSFAYDSNLESEDIENVTPSEDNYDEDSKPINDYITQPLLELQKLKDFHKTPIITKDSIKNIYFFDGASKDTVNGSNAYLNDSILDFEIEKGVVYIKSPTIVLDGEKRDSKKLKIGTYEIENGSKQVTINFNNVYASLKRNTKLPESTPQQPEVNTVEQNVAKDTKIGDIFYDAVGNLVQRISLDEYKKYSKMPESVSGVKVKILKELIETAIPNSNPKLAPTTKKELVDVKEIKVNTLFENSKIKQSETKDEIQIPYFRTNRIKEGRETLPTSEGYFAEAQFGKGYYISLDKPYLDSSFYNEENKVEAVFKQGILNINPNEVIDLSNLIIPQNSKKEKDVEEIFESKSNKSLEQRFLDKGYKAVIRVVDGRALEMIIYDLNLANRLIKEQQEFKGDTSDFYEGGKYFNSNYRNLTIPKGSEELFEQFKKFQQS